MNEDFQFTVNSWTVSRENKEYHTPIFNLFKRNLKLQSEQESLSGDFYVLEVPEWINVLPLTSDNHIVLVEQYRFGIEEPTLEIPGGMVDAGEDPKEAAQRELLEETGYGTNQWESLGKVSANPAIMDNFAHIYLARDCSYKKEPNLDTHERIKVHKIPIDIFLSYVNDGTIDHSIVVAAAGKYLLHQEG